MKEIRKELKVAVSPDVAFEKFLNELNEWWPREYTWSQDKLQEIRIDGSENGLCTEIGPYGFRCDWGRVTEVKENESIALKWQIGPNREPVPDPAKASDIRISFIREGKFTIMSFEHFNFENHGEGADEYRKMMDSDQGWDYILERYVQFVS